MNWGILPGALVSKVVADAVLPRHALYYACLGEPFDGKEAARIGMINSAVPASKLEDAVTDLAERLMKKSPAVLRATKHAIRHVRTMDVPQAYDYLSAKGQAIKTADKEDSYNTGLRQFLDEKSYKPTYRAVQARHAADRPAVGEKITAANVAQKQRRRGHCRGGANGKERTSTGGIVNATSHSVCLWTDRAGCSLTGQRRGPVLQGQDDHDDRQLSRPAGRRTSKGGSSRSICRRIFPAIQQSS